MAIRRAVIPNRGAGKDDVLGMKNGVFTRGVLFDIPKLKGVQFLGDNEAIYAKDLEAWEKKVGFKVEPGDAVLVRTGRWVLREPAPLRTKGRLEPRKQI